MRNLSVGVVSAAIVALTGCSTTNKSALSGNLETDVKTNLAADLEIDTSKKVTGTASQSILFFFIPLGTPNKFADGVTYGSATGAEPGLFSSLFDSTGMLKAAAAYNAIKPGNFELIIAPTYQIEVNNYLVFKKTTVQVTGFGAKVKSVRPNK